MKFYVRRARVVNGEVAADIQFVHSMESGTLTISEHRMQDTAPDNVPRAAHSIIARLVAAMREADVATVEEAAKAINGKTFWAA